MVGLGCALLGVLRLFSFQKSIFPVFSIFLSGGLLIFIIGSDWMMGWRFVAPFYPILCVLVGLGWFFLLKRLEFKPFWITWVILLSLIPLVWIHQNKDRKVLNWLVEERAMGYKRGHMQLSQWIQKSTKPGDTVALMDIGIIGFENPQLNILDFTGLTDRFVAKSPGGFLKKEFDLNYIFDQKPRIIVLVCNAKRLSEKAVQLHHHNPMEEKIYIHPEFKNWYIENNSKVPPDASLVQRVASQFGSKASFLQQNHYLLMAFQRREI